MKVFLVLACCLLCSPSAMCASSRTELIIALENNPPHFNPAVVSGSLVGGIGAQLFAGLTRLSEKGRPLPYFAINWEHSLDYRSFTFSLRDGLFHDGTPMTAEDVAFSIMASKTYHPFTPMLEPVAAVETPDAHTVIIHLNRPFPELPSILIPSLVPILPRHVYGAGGELPTHPANLSPVGSGPFMLESFVPDQHIRLVRNPSFFLPGKPVLDRITYRIFWDEAELAPALVNKDVDICLAPSPLLSQKIIEEYPDIPLGVQPVERLHAYICMVYNLSTGPLADRRVREALSLAIDREVFCRLSLLPIRPQQGPIPPGAPFHSPCDMPANREKAEQLLDEAGYLRKKDGRRFSLTIDCPSGSHLFSSLVFSMLIKEFGKLGIEITPQYALSFAQWQKRLSAKEMQASLDVLFAWHDPVVGIHRLYQGKDFSMRGYLGQYRNAEAERLLLAASSESDAGKRQKLYADFQHVVANDYPMLWIATTNPELLHQPNILHLDSLGLSVISPMDGISKKSAEATGGRP